MTAPWDCRAASSPPVLGPEGDVWPLLSCPVAPTGACMCIPTHVQSKCFTLDTGLLRDTGCCGRKKLVGPSSHCSYWVLAPDLDLVTSPLWAFVFSSVIPTWQSWGAVKTRSKSIEYCVCATVGVVKGKPIRAAHIIEDLLWPRCCSEPFPCVVSFSLLCSPLTGLVPVLMHARTLRHMEVWCIQHMGHNNRVEIAIIVLYCWWQCIYIVYWIFNTSPVKSTFFFILNLILFSPF